MTDTTARGYFLDDDAYGTPTIWRGDPADAYPQPVVGRHFAHLTDAEWQRMVDAFIARPVADDGLRALEGAQNDIRERRREFSRLGAHDQYLSGLDDAFGLVSNRRRAVLDPTPKTPEDCPDCGHGTADGRLACGPDCNQGRQSDDGLRERVQALVDRADERQDASRRLVTTTALRAVLDATTETRLADRILGGSIRVGDPAYLHLDSEGIKTHDPVGSRCTLPDCPHEHYPKR